MDHNVPSFVCPTVGNEPRRARDAMRRRLHCPVGPLRENEFSEIQSALLRPQELSSQLDHRV